SPKGQHIGDHMLVLCRIKAGVGWHIVGQIAAEVLFIEIHSDVGSRVTDPVLVGATVERRVAITVRVPDLVEAVVVRSIGQNNGKTLLTSPSLICGQVG